MVVTGAASGIGAAFARVFAAEKLDLLLIDRNGGGLMAVADRLRADHGVTVDTVVADLTSAAELEPLASRLAEERHLVLLVNCAGFGTYSFFSESELRRQIAMVDLHVVASLRLSHAVLPGMVARRRGSVINVASAAAFMRFPRDATYVGTKAFLVAFTECLAIELVNTGVTVQALCPAWVHTEFSKVGDYAKVGYKSPIPRFMFIEPEEVVRASLSRLRKGSGTIVPTFRARLAVQLLGSRLGVGSLALARRARERLRSGRT